MLSQQWLYVTSHNFSTAFQLRTWNLVNQYTKKIILNLVLSVPWPETVAKRGYLFWGEIYFGTTLGQLLHTAVSQMLAGLLKPHGWKESKTYSNVFSRELDQSAVRVQQTYRKSVMSVSLKGHFRYGKYYRWSDKFCVESGKLVQRKTIGLILISFSMNKLVTHLQIVYSNTKAAEQKMNLTQCLQCTSILQQCSQIFFMFTCVTML